MQICIDVDLSDTGQVIARHCVETDVLANNKCETPVASGVKIDVPAYLAWLSANKAHLTITGWNVPTKLAGYPTGTTRWQVLVAACNDKDAPASLKALGLT